MTVSRAVTGLTWGLLLLTISACRQHPPAALSAEEDHQRTMALLGIEALRRGADGDPASPHAANYDESKANGRMDTLPEVLVLDSGDPVTDPCLWWGQRRFELIEHFEEELYGRPPEQPPEVHWRELAEVSDEVAGEPVIRRRLAGEVDNSDYPLISVTLDMTVTLPKNTTEPVPVVLALTLAPEVIEHWAETMPQPQAEAFLEGVKRWKEQVLARGWGVAELVATSIQPDGGESLTRGIIGLTNEGRPRDLEDWGALRAWAWGASRALDYLDASPDVRGDRVAIHGHSRYGKAALVAMAFDPRFAMGYISSSGEGGMKLWRRNYGEQAGNIASTALYHWMAGDFLKYAGPLEVTDLPVDSHQLLGLVAPRPVFIGAGLEGDGWVDPRGMFMAAVHAGPIYRMLGAEGLSSPVYPEVGTAITDGDIAFRQHNKGHTPAPNWEPFLDFAHKYW